MSSEPSRVDVHKVFDRIAPRYDIFNRISSFGLDKFWRRKLAASLNGQKQLKVLDVATGTGDLLLSLFEVGCDISTAAGIDVSANMLAIAERKLAAHNVNLVQADITVGAFAEDEYDAAICAFGVRNFADVESGLKQMYRILRQGGRVLILEFSLPRNSIIKILYLFYLRFIIPILGKIIAGDTNAYRYLSKTIQTFPSGGDFCRLLENAGFADVCAEPLTFGAVTLYSAYEPL
jgi:demethylmenaquinone methyltransferase/2-methoxy-6-polyprenyl-1,4-benzoquinol methylase